MSTITRTLLIVTVITSIGTVLLWQATGGDYYTKFEVVEQVKTPIDPDDPLAATGFYENDSVVETVRREEFRFGLLPTPSGLIDRHVFAVLSIAGPLWALTIISLLIDVKRRRNNM